ncbi:hypothetical protein BT96DRAFT_172846 [Gymnopus androsaceus JB14]|uniref:Homeobox domain-containing protein n=1 Tax=Gymnopus androsaceus JB14 TaxID=1447944 RepID=A0A6A4I8I3_9AGAR|nr:hypothetical protein BT96DRAFT_172846 [Gymnopus androsaceus JB14]
MESSTSSSSESTYPPKLTPERLKILRDAFYIGLQMPTKEEKESLLERITSLPNCEHYTYKSPNGWFKNNRKAARQYAQNALQPSRKRLRLTSKGLEILHDAYKRGIRTPTSTQRERLVKRITALPGCGHYTNKNVAGWFKDKRRKEHVTVTASSSSSSSSSAPTQKFSFTPSDEETLHTLFANSPYPSKDLVSVWAELLDAHLDDVEAWIFAEQQALEQSTHKRQHSPGTWPSASESTAALSQCPSPVSQSHYPHLPPPLSISQYSSEGWQQPGTDLDAKFVCLPTPLSIGTSSRSSSPALQDSSDGAVSPCPRTCTDATSESSKLPAVPSSTPPSPNPTDTKVEVSEGFHSIFASSMAHLIG